MFHNQASLQWPARPIISVLVTPHQFLTSWTADIVYIDALNQIDWLLYHYVDALVELQDRLHEKGIDLDTESKIHQLKIQTDHEIQDLKQQVCCITISIEVFYQSSCSNVHLLWFSSAIWVYMMVDFILCWIQRKKSTFILLTLLEVVTLQKLFWSEWLDQGLDTTPITKY